MRNGNNWSENLFDHSMSTHNVESNGKLWMKEINELNEITHERNESLIMSHKLNDEKKYISKNMKKCLKGKRIIKDICNPCEDQDKVGRSCAVACVDIFFFERQNEFYPTGYNKANMRECPEIWKDPDNKLYVKPAIFSNYLDKVASLAALLTIVVIMFHFTWMWMGPKVVYDMYSICDSKWTLLFIQFKFIMHFGPEGIRILYFTRLDQTRLD